jgi:hypothetical protein
MDAVERRGLVLSFRNQIRQGGREGRERFAITQTREPVVEEVAFHGAGPDDDAQAARDRAEECVRGCDRWLIFLFQGPDRGLETLGPTDLPWVAGVEARRASPQDTEPWGLAGVPPTRPQPPPPFWPSAVSLLTSRLLIVWRQQAGAEITTNVVKPHADDLSSLDETIEEQTHRVVACVRRDDAGVVDGLLPRRTEGLAGQRAQVGDGVAVVIGGGQRSRESESREQKGGDEDGEAFCEHELLLSRRDWGPPEKRRSLGNILHVENI